MLGSPIPKSLIDYLLVAIFFELYWTPPQNASYDFLLKEYWLDFGFWQPDHGPAVPKFGDWDESDPAAAEGYTHIFNRVREEKQSGTGKVPAITTETSYSNGQKQYGNDNQKVQRIHSIQLSSSILVITYILTAYNITLLCIFWKFQGISLLFSEYWFGLARNLLVHCLYQIFWPTYFYFRAADAFHGAENRSFRWKESAWSLYTTYIVHKVILASA